MFLRTELPICLQLRIHDALILVNMPLIAFRLRYPNIRINATRSPFCHSDIVYAPVQSTKTIHQCPLRWLNVCHRAAGLREGCLQSFATETPSIDVGCADEILRGWQFGERSTVGGLLSVRLGRLTEGVVVRPVVHLNRNSWFYEKKWLICMCVLCIQIWIQAKLSIFMTAEISFSVSERTGYYTL